MTRLNHGCGALLLGAVAFLTACPPEGEGEGEGQGADAGILLSGDPKIEILDPVEGQTIAAATPEPAVGGNAVVIEVDPDENWTGPDLRTAITVLVQPKAGGPGDECRFAFDGFCDEPDLCAAGSDTTDCG